MKNVFSFKVLSFDFLVAFSAVIVLAVSGGFYFTGHQAVASVLLKYMLLVGMIPLWVTMIRDMVRGHFGVDLIAGVALLGTFFFGEYLPGVVILLMLSGGQLLEGYAMRRARLELTALLSRAPEKAHVREGEKVRDVKVEEITVGMIVIIKPGEIIPVDGFILEGRSLVDESTLTGESVPVEKREGNLVFASTENKEGVLMVQVEKAAGETKYEQIVKIVRQAEESKAPLVRLADQYSVYFTAITALFGLAAWFIFHDAVRVIAVLVVATPCPLILATPIAIISGMSKSAHRGVIIKNGGALEMLAKVRTFVFDKTGTVTLGTPTVERIEAFGIGAHAMLSIAASLDQLSTHVLARALTAYAEKNKTKLLYPKNFTEQFGDGVTGDVTGKKYAFGKLSYIRTIAKACPPEVLRFHDQVQAEGRIAVYLADQETVVGAIVFADAIRGEARQLFDTLKKEGIQRVVLLTGDKESRAKNVAEELGIAEYRSDCLPEDKLAFIETIPLIGHPVAMIGDGVNDAPALAKADVGIALGAHGKTASSDVADIVILHNSIMRVSDVLSISRTTMKIAKQGIWFGMGASIVLMCLALAGLIPPLYGALLQEGIDVLVIVNALRVGSVVKKLQLGK
jgi:heavy metal translocating P-type ATPase